MRASSVATVNASVQQVWAVLSDYEGMAEWAPGMRAEVTRQGSPVPNGVGTVRKITPMPGVTFVEEITGFEPERKLTYKAVSGIPLRNYVGEVELRQVRGGTEITYSVQADERIPVVEAAGAKAVSKVLLTLLTRRVNAVS